MNSLLRYLGEGIAKYRQDFVKTEIRLD